MAQFPRTETDIFALAQQLAVGFTDHADVFPAPPVEAPEFANLMNGYITAQNAGITAQAAAEAATTAKTRPWRG